jgi:hypothetical protein
MARHRGRLVPFGRPVLVVPFIQPADMKLDRVMACWDGSQHAARAMLGGLTGSLLKAMTAPALMSH